MNMDPIAPMPINESDQRRNLYTRLGHRYTLSDLSRANISATMWDLEPKVIVSQNWLMKLQKWRSTCTLSHMARVLLHMHYTYFVALWHSTQDAVSIENHNKRFIPLEISFFLSKLNTPSPFFGASHMTSRHTHLIYNPNEATQPDQLNPSYFTS